MSWIGKLRRALSPPPSKHRTNGESPCSSESSWAAPLGCSSTENTLPVIVFVFRSHVRARRVLEEVEVSAAYFARSTPYKVIHPVQALVTPSARFLFMGPERINEKLAGMRPLMVIPVDVTMHQILD